MVDVVARVGLVGSALIGLTTFAACAPIQRVGRADPVPARAPGQEPGAAAGEGVTVEAGLAGLIEAHNRIRAEHDLPPLAPADGLNEAARVHALDMARNGFMAHEGSDDSTPPERIARQGFRAQAGAENVARGHRTIEAVMDGWMDSPGHRKNILGDFTEIGVAVARDAAGEPFWAVNFGTPWPQYEPAEAAARLVEAINAHRKAAGKTPLRVEPRLEAVAMEHARDNAARGKLDRGRSNADNPLDQVAARGYRYRNLALANAAGHPEAEDVVETWTAKGNRGADLLGNFADIGPGYATDDSGQPYWTILLAQPLRR